MNDVPQRCTYFVAIMLVALTLGPSMAHLLELPDKIGLGREQYFVVQGIYRGWALLGILIVLALGATLTLAIVVRMERRPMFLAAGAFVCLSASQSLFWTFTFPANRATRNWTFAPENWERLRDQWEYSHAGGALLNLVALALVVLSAMSWTGGRRPKSAPSGNP